MNSQNLILNFFSNFSDPVILRSNVEIRPNEVVTLTANRERLESRLSVNDEEPVYDYHRIPGLSLKTPLYIGGYDKQKIKLSSYVGVENGFNGCISEVIFCSG